MSFASPLPYPATAAALSQSQVPSSSPPSSGLTGNGRGCCENGRPVLTDPTTGQSVCSCQYSSALLGYSRLPGLSGSLFSPPYSTSGTPGAASGYGVALSSEGSAFYSPLTAGGGTLRDSTDAWRSLTQTSLYDSSAMGFYPYGGYGGLDLNARRKNATRESTNTLKAWLHEHIKNPYPTKGEKIMLAIITKMTLTQVSTWFANARRRLKKENKMTWSPRNRSEDGDDDDDDEDVGDEAKSADDKEKRLSDGDENNPDSKGQRPAPHNHHHHHNNNHHHHNNNNSNTKLHHRGESNSASPAHSIGEDSRGRLSPPGSRGSDPGSYHLTHEDASAGDGPKPKIWSVTDFLHPGSKASHQLPHHQQQPSSCKETGMKMDIMRCVPTSTEAAASAVDLTGRTVTAGSGSLVSAAHAHAVALSRSTVAAAAAGFLPPMTSLSHVQQLNSYQTALASYAAHGGPYSPYAGALAASAAEMNKLVMKPTATRFNPYAAHPKPLTLDTGVYPTPRDFSSLREGE